MTTDYVHLFKYMPDYNIILKPVYSQTVPTPEGLQLPEGWLLSSHQAKTLEALQSSNDYDVVFNTALTGDGKSLAAYLPSMTGKTYTLAMYPTNELARDQEKQVQYYQKLFNPKYHPQINRLNADLLEEFIATRKLPSKLEGIDDFSSQSEILLTNPDIFHYIHNFYYLKGKYENPDKLFRRIDEKYKLFIYDEFHIFSSPQFCSVLNSILLMKHTAASAKKFLFLSATPNEQLLDFLSRSGLNVKPPINPMQWGGYKFSGDSLDRNWRKIGQQFKLAFPRGLEPNLRSSYAWIEENAETIILKFFLDNPGSQGAIILNSIASVYKLLPKLQQLFEPYKLKALPNTGLTGETVKSKSVEEADLIIGTSTIDVGVDFKINFLVFEASDAGNFIQRLGRLGRHKAGRSQNFQAYQAYALIPNFIVERLFEQKQHPLQDDEYYDRITFTEAIRSAWTFVNQFAKYPSRWGGIQSAYIYSKFQGNKQMKKDYPEVAKKFGASVQKALGISIQKMNAQFYRCQNEGKTKVIEEARSFRGSSQLNCAIYDKFSTGELERDRFKIYNLPGILSNFTFELWDKSDFMQQAESAGVTTKRFDETLCYLKLTGCRDVREDWYFYRSGNLREIAQSGKIQVLKNLEICQPHGYGINHISDRLGNRGLVCFISDRDRNQLRATLGLPFHFQAYPLTDRPDDRSPPYTIAFGQDALLLETLIWHYKPKEDEGWFC